LDAGGSRALHQHVVLVADGHRGHGGEVETLEAGALLGGAGVVVQRLHVRAGLAVPQHLDARLKDAVLVAGEHAHVGTVQQLVLGRRPRFGVAHVDLLVRTGEPSAGGGSPAKGQT